MEKLNDACKIQQIETLKPILDVETRWNSTYNMVARAIQLKTVSLNIAI